jgi:hypothetical protein
LHGSEISNIFRTGRENPIKIAKYLKDEENTVWNSIRDPFSSLFKTTSFD